MTNLDPLQIFNQFRIEAYGRVEGIPSNWRSAGEEADELEFGDDNASWVWFECYRWKRRLCGQFVTTSSKAPCSFARCSQSKMKDLLASKAVTVRLTLSSSLRIYRHRFLSLCAKLSIV